MVSFCLWNFHSFYSPNCQRPRFDGTCREVNALAYRKIMSFPQPFSLDSFAVSISVFAACLGALISSSYSTFCNVSCFIFIYILTTIFRWQKARILNCITTSLLRFFRRSFLRYYTPTVLVAIRTSDWSITWFVCWGGGYRRYIQTGRKRASHGHIFRGMSVYFD